MKMHDCPKYSHCNANLCPLDPDISERSYLQGEPVCFYMLESAKKGAENRFKSVHSGDKLLQAIRDTLPALLIRCAPLRKPLDRAKRTGPRLGKRPGKEVRHAA